jgi:hypothetical protein
MNANRPDGQESIAPQASQGSASPAPATPPSRLTAHQLATLLLQGPDHPVVIAVSDQIPITSPAQHHGPSAVHPWDQDDDFGVVPDPDRVVPSRHNRDAFPVVVIGLAFAGLPARPVIRFNYYSHFISF